MKKLKEKKSELASVLLTKAKKYKTNTFNLV